MPFFVTTKLSKIRRASMLIPNPTSYVKSALKTVGIEDRTFGYFAHAIQVYILYLSATFSHQMTLLLYKKLSLNRTRKNGWSHAGLFKLFTIYLIEF